MKSNLVLFALTAAIAVSLSSCSSTTGSSAQVVTIPETGAKVYTVNGTPLHHYDPSLYTPYAYDHRGMSHNAYAQAQAARYDSNGARRSIPRGSVEVGRFERSGQ